MSFTDMIVGFFDGFKDKIENHVKGALNNLEKKVMKKVNNIKRKIYRSLLEIASFFIGFICLIIGALLFLMRFFSADYIFLGAGLVFLYIALMFKLIK